MSAISHTLPFVVAVVATIPTPQVVASDFTNVLGPVLGIVNLSVDNGSTLVTYIGESRIRPT